MDDKLFEIEDAELPKRDLMKIPVPSFRMDEMEDYYSKNKAITKLIKQLATTRKKAKKITDEQVRKPHLKNIGLLKAEIKSQQLKHYQDLKKIKIVGIGEPRGGLIKEHPGGKTFHLQDEKPVSLPVYQAKQLIKEGNAQEAK